MKMNFRILRTVYDDAQIKTDISVEFEFWFEGGSCFITHVRLGRRDRNPHHKFPLQTLMASLVTQRLFYESHCHSERLIWQPLALGCPGLHAPVVTCETPATPAATLTPCDQMQCPDTDIQATAEAERGNRKEKHVSATPSASTSGDTR